MLIWNPNLSSFAENRRILFYSYFSEKKRVNLSFPVQNMYINTGRVRVRTKQETALRR